MQNPGPRDKENNMNSDEKSPTPNALRKWLPLGVVVAILAAGYLAGLHEYLTLSSLIQNRETFREFVSENFVAAIIGFMVLYASLVALSFPGASLLTVASGLLFGGVLGGFLTVFSATTGAVIIFLIARSSFGDFLEQRAGPFIHKMVEGFQKDAFSYLLTIRLTPVFPFWVINIVPALLNMRLLPYAIATFLGIIPGTFAYAYIGAGLDSIILAQQEANPGCAQSGTCEIDIKSLVTKEIIFAMIGLAIISILPVVIRKLRGGKGLGDQNVSDN